MTRRDAVALVKALREKPDERPSVKIEKNASGISYAVRVSARSLKVARERAQAEFTKLRAYAEKNGGGG